MHLPRVIPPNSLVGRLLLPTALILAFSGHPARAGEVAANSIELLPGGATKMNYEDRVSLNSRWDLGYYLFQMQEFGEAAKEFEKIRQVLPQDASLLALIGSCYSMSGNWKEGERALLDAKAQNPDDEDINGLLGQFYLSAGQSLKGAAYLEHSLKITPEQEDLRARLATLYLDAGKEERARYHLEYLLRARGADEGKGFGFPELDYDYARCLLQAGKFKEGLAFAQLAYKAEPANPRYSRALGLCLMGTNQYGEAARMLAAGRNELQAEELVYLQWGEALFLDRRWESAEAVWLEGVSRFPKSYDLMSRLVEYYIQIAKPAKARRVIVFGETRNPGHPGNLLLDARLHRKLGDFAASWKSLERLKRRACGAMAKEALWEEAQLAFASSKFGTCDKLLDNLLAVKHRPAEAHLMKAKLALYRGDKALAQAQVLKAKDAEPYNVKVVALAKEAFTGPSGAAAVAGILRDVK
ncbi:MAG: Tetratricopeptide repeat domain protein [Fibrobacteres bacterium]|nr:Tetratricopeptide repeat domain protein [Fibrobacterota bacterium]